MKSKYNPLTPLAPLVIGLGLLTTIHSARAQSPIYWVNAGGGDWFDTNNWSARTLPGSTNAVFITLPGSYTVTLAGPGPVTVDGYAASLTLGDSGGGQKLAIGSHGNLAVTGAVSTAANSIIALDNDAMIHAQDGGLIAGTVEWTSGAFWGPFTIAPSGVVNLRGPGPMNLRRELINHGVINFFDGALTFSESLLDNRPDGLINFTNGGSLGFNWIYATINNAGTIRKSGGTNSISIGSPFQFTNSGSVFVQSGALVFDNAAFTSSGLFDVASDAAVYFKNGTFNFQPGHHCQGDGYYGVPNPSSVMLQGVIPDLNFRLDNGISVNATLTGIMQWNAGTISGTFTIASNGVLNLNTAASRYIAGTLLNHGTINWLQGYMAFSGATLVNYADGVIIAGQDNGIGWGTLGNALQNLGTFRKSAGTGTFAISGLTFTNSGLVDVQSGTLSFASLSTYGQAGGQLNFGLRSVSDYGGIVFASPTPLTGTLSANLLGGYTPAAGTQFQVISSGGLSGGFTALNLPNYFFETNNANNVFLVVGTGGPVTLIGSALMGTNYTCSFQTEAGQSYTVQRKDDLTTANWMYYTNFTGDGSLMRVIAPVTNVPQRFFRVRQP